MTRMRETVKRLAWASSILAFLGPCALASVSDFDDVLIGVYVDEGADPFCVEHAVGMFEWMGFSIRRVDAADVNGRDLQDLDAIYFPGGDSPPYIERISADGKAGLLDAVDGGMVYIGTCAGSMFAAEAQVWEGERYRDGQLGVFRGSAVGPAPGLCDREWCYATLAANSEHPATDGMPKQFEVLWYNSPYLRASPGTGTHVLAIYAATGQPAIVAQGRGAGWVLLTGPHPEYTPEEAWRFLEGCMLWILGGGV